ncbi:MAG: DUF3943 domain-containing protein [FCB group bacterium]
MKKTLFKKSLTFAAVVVITILTIKSICYSQVVLETKEKSKQINESGNYPTENSFAYQSDTIKGTPDEKIVKSNSDPANKNDQIKSIDSTKYSMFGDLLRDDPVYNKKYPLWIPMVEVLGVHVSLGLINRYVFNSDFARVGINSWKYNIKAGWEWDADRFAMNFLGHPYSGSLNFISARSNGYNFWESIPFAIGGSLLWEYFGENTRPSFNDVINTPISGAGFGELFYRLSSNILDDRTTGTERFFREFGAAVFSPTRFFNRLIQGKLSRVTSEEVYQKQPLNIEISAGLRKLNDGSSFWTGPQNIYLNGQLDYGYALEKREWKPFDYFKVRVDMNLGVGRKIVDNITGYGILFGKNVQCGDLEMVIGGFQHYNYFDNTTFELGAIGLGPGIMSKYPLSRESYLFTNFHLAIVPLAGNSTRLGPDTTQVRDYNFGGGAEGKIECGLNLNWASIQFIGYYFWIHTYGGTAGVDIKGNNYIGIIRPRITFRIIRNLNIGFEQMVYYSDRYTANFGDYHAVRTEQRIYLMLNVGNFKL